MPLPEPTPTPRPKSREATTLPTSRLVASPARPCQGASGKGGTEVDGAGAASARTDRPASLTRSICLPAFNAGQGCGSRNVKVRRLNHLIPSAKGL